MALTKKYFSANVGIGKICIIFAPEQHQQKIKMALKQNYIRLRQKGESPQPSNFVGCCSVIVNLVHLFI